MRILFIATLNTGATALDRVAALQSHGHEVIPFDTNRASRSLGSLQSSLLGRFNVGPRIGILQRWVLDFASDLDFDGVWVDKGVWIEAETILALKKLARKGFAIHPSPDAQLVDNRSRHLLRALPHYDLVVTTKPFELEAYKAYGVQDVFLVLQGFGDRFFNIAAPGNVYEHDLVFVGHCQRHYRKHIQAAVAAQLPIALWGPRWEEWSRFDWRLKRAFKGKGLWGDIYPQTLQRSRIALGLLGKHIPETTTTRSFEIPASGCLLLAEHTDDHAALFEDGREAVFFRSREEMCDKAHYYLQHETVRADIAAAGRERCLRSGYHVNEQVGRVLAHLAARHGVR